MTGHEGSEVLEASLLFLQLRHYMPMGGQRHTPAALHLRKRPGTHFLGSWVGSLAGLDGRRKSRPHRDSISGPSSP